MSRPNVSPTSSEDEYWDKVLSEDEQMVDQQSGTLIKTPVRKSSKELTVLGAGDPTPVQSSTQDPHHNQLQAKYRESSSEVYSQNQRMGKKGKNMKDRRVREAYSPDNVVGSQRSQIYQREASDSAPESTGIAVASTSKLPSPRRRPLSQTSTRTSPSPTRSPRPRKKPRLASPPARVVSPDLASFSWLYDSSFDGILSIPPAFAFVFKKANSSLSLPDSISTPPSPSFSSSSVNAGTSWNTTSTGPKPIDSPQPAPPSPVPLTSSFKSSRDFNQEVSFELDKDELSMDVTMESDTESSQQLPDDIRASSGVQLLLPVESVPPSLQKIRRLRGVTPARPTSAASSVDSSGVMATTFFSNPTPSPKFDAISLLDKIELSPTLSEDSSPASPVDSFVDQPSPSELTPLILPAALEVAADTFATLERTELAAILSYDSSRANSMEPNANQLSPLGLSPLVVKDPLEVAGDTFVKQPSPILSSLQVSPQLSPFLSPSPELSPVLSSSPTGAISSRQRFTIAEIQDARQGLNSHPSHDLTANTSSTSSLRPSPQDNLPLRSNLPPRFVKRATTAPPSFESFLPLPTVAKSLLSSSTTKSVDRRSPTPVERQSRSPSKTLHPVASAPLGVQLRPTAWLVSNLSVASVSLSPSHCESVQTDSSRRSTSPPTTRPPSPALSKPLQIAAPSRKNTSPPTLSPPPPSKPCLPDRTAPPPPIPFPAYFLRAENQVLSHVQGLALNEEEDYESETSEKLVRMAPAAQRVASKRLPYFADGSDSESLRMDEYSSSEADDEEPVTQALSECSADFENWNTVRRLEELEEAVDSDYDEDMEARGDPRHAIYTGDRVDETLATTRRTRSSQKAREATLRASWQTKQRRPVASVTPVFEFVGIESDTEEEPLVFPRKVILQPDTVRERLMKGVDSKFFDPASTYSRLLTVTVMSLHLPKAPIPSGQAKRWTIEGGVTLSLSSESQTPIPGIELRSSFRIQPQKRHSPSNYWTLIPSAEISESLTLRSNSSSRSGVMLEVTYLSAEDFSLRRASIPLISDGKFIENFAASTFFRFEGDLSSEGGEGITLELKWIIQDDSDQSGSEEMVARLEDLLIRDAEPWLPEPILMRKRRQKKNTRGALVVPKVKYGRLGVSFKTKEAKNPGDAWEYSDEETFDSVTSAIRDNSKVFDTVDRPTPYLLHSEAILLLKAHSLWTMVNFHISPIVEREIQCWEYYIPVLYHHFATSSPLFPHLETSDRLLMGIRHYLRNLGALLSWMDHQLIFSRLEDKVLLPMEENLEEMTLRMMTM